MLYYAIVNSVKLNLHFPQRRCQSLEAPVRKTEPGLKRCSLQSASGDSRSREIQERVAGTGTKVYRVTQIGREQDRIQGIEDRAGSLFADSAPGSTGTRFSPPLSGVRAGAWSMMTSRLLLVMLLLLIPMIPTFWAILDIPKRRFSSLRKKIMWFLVVSSLPCVGALCYLLLARRHTTPSEPSTP